MNNGFQNTQTDMELENMRQQMNMLKNKLEQQEIVNDRIIRQSMKNTASNITRRYYMIMLLCLLIIPHSYWTFIKLSGFDFSFWIGTTIFILCCAGATFYNLKRNIRASEMMHHNLVDVHRNIARAKKLDVNSLWVGIPLVILWAGWWTYEVWKYNGPDAAQVFLVAGSIGAIIGGAIGFFIHIKTQRQYQEIIDQIEELTKGD
ncbi:MAG: hypothetical protein J5661_05270 [Bacteroidaceae bacterium]|nr:hypothetical protein [Bacteroidaceae bacterium]